MTVLRGVAGWFALACFACVCSAQGPLIVERAEYEDSLRGMWLGKSIANWTGLLAEGKVTQPPFLTDDDWGINLGKGPLRFILDQDPWLADDDTDVEYVYLHLLDQHATTELTGEQIAAGWLEHMDDDYLWVSNQRALDLMRLGLIPPETGFCNANEFWLKIDAQLTTEFFGALAPGMSGEALEMADLPIRTTARSHAAHAAQFHVLLYSLAALADRSLPMEDRILWMVEEARRYLPDSSKAADIVDFVLADFLDNPDPDDWERTRDLVYDRYQLNAAANGFRYRAWTESSVNFAAGLIALLYGRGDFLRTVQIGTLTGWDCDNGTATMGGLLGLMLGHDALVAQIRAEFPGFEPSDRYDIERTRDNLPDRLPDDPLAQDTFTMMATRCADVVERRIRMVMPLMHTTRAVWLIPSLPGGDPLLQSPLHRDWLRSANNRVRAEGGTVQAISSVSSDPPAGYGWKQAARFANGYEMDDSGIDAINNQPRQWYSTLGAGQKPGDSVTLSVVYDRPVEVWSVLFIEGSHHDDGAVQGGWFDSALFEVRVDGAWFAPAGAVDRALDPDVPFQAVQFILDVPLLATGVRVRGGVGGTSAFVTCSEIDALASPIPRPITRSVLNRVGR
ncbi:MAG: ADP-ribosylglycohydrolase family protein [Phycisphaeraceae bacterium]|nr:ADP-ribosylglycohydrolase family protein [Phycisphaeraceae bacterium]